MSLDLEEQYDKIYRYCYMKTQHQQTAEDITQETFLRFLEDHTYKEMGKRMAYFYTIARNLCMDSFRRKKAFLLSDEMVQKERFVKEDAEGMIVQNIDLKAALGRLAPEEEELIFLRYVNELPIQQLSRILGISRFAVYRRIRECLDKLKQRIENLALLGIICPVLLWQEQMALINIGISLLLPYLVTCLCSLFIVRKIREKESLYYCSGVTVLVCGLEMIISIAGLQIYELVKPIAWLGILALLLGMTGRECLKMLKQTERARLR